MKFKHLIKDWAFWLIIYSIIVSFVMILLIVMYNSHQCPKLETPVLQEKYINEIKKISNAENKTDIDSLLLEYYGFKSK